MTPALDQRIQNLLTSRKFPDAEKLIKERLAEDPKNADAYFFYGVWHYFQSKVGPTIQNLRKALSCDPRHTDAAICLSVLYNDIGLYDEAKKVFEQANQSVAYHDTNQDLGINKKFAVKHLELADLYFRYRRYSEAIDEYTKAASLDPHTLEIRIRLAKAFAKKGYVTRAIQELQQLKNENSSYIPARIQLGLLHYSQGNILDAELEWEAVSNIEPANREASSYLDMARRTRVTAEPHAGRAPL